MSSEMFFPFYAENRTYYINELFGRTEALVNGDYSQTGLVASEESPEEIYQFD